ncbi:MAG: phosphate/phosphite/phosphonate ABC transporter substrate-binding protein [Gammaproteobacteria bacterium]|nr:phosphate/phosphite/phosphonate ABC transporter substrate-binding protein [Gammaproteobacteria bacterium]MBU1407639.1 phosphate/phosphite/phosphonate ABC transporter substrate-binding protein [Gammaproteobacteria bacterium]MBU1531752.1 phosphate/phosphite/phosphonate ABC transporter substrate-binding protein [Gammaproteobacteria bacterium]
MGDRIPRNPFKEVEMRRRSFLAGLTILPALPLVAHAAKGTLNIGIYPGTGKADIVMGDFRAYAMPFAQALGAAVNAQPKLTLFRSIRSVMGSLKSGRLDLYFVPPSVAVAVLDHDYSPIARVRDQATGVLVRRKGATVSAVALTEKESWLDVMARHTLRKNKIDGLKIYNFKTQDDVALSMQRDYAQAGSLRSKLADALVAKGEYEIWHPLPTTPDFTLMASNRMSATEQNRLGAAAVALSPAAIQSLQQTIHSKVTGFVIDKEADYKTIKQAIVEAGY